jgi:hypothetical protein
MLHWHAIERLRDHPKAFVKIVAALNEVLATHPRLRDLCQFKRIKTYHFSEIYRLLTGSSYAGGSNGNGLGYGPGSGVVFPPTGKSMFDDIPNNVLKKIIESTSTMNSVQISGILVNKVD